MGLTISSALSSATLAAANSVATSPAARAPQPAQQASPQPTGNSGDTVRLSESQQVYQLYNQGQQVSQIATALSLPVELVNNYLGISSASG